MKRAPFIPIILAFISGILIGNTFNIEWQAIVFTLFLSLTIVSIFRLLPLKTKFFYEKYVTLFYIISLICAGSIIYKYQVTKKPEISSREETYTGFILDIPRETEKSVSFTIKLKAKKEDSKWTKKDVKILTYMAKDSNSLQLKPGDCIIFNSYINKVRNYGNPEEFNYKRHLAIHSIHYQTFISSNKWKELKQAKSNSLIALSNSYRLHLINRLKHSKLDSNQYSITSALVLGYKDLLSQEIKQKFSSSGAVHILAVSGLHVGIIYILLYYALIFLNRYNHTRILKTFIILLILCIYAFLTGLSPSVSRATLMFSIVAIGKELRRETSVFNSLAFSAFILLVINPKLLFSVGFQLSYLAVASIVFFQPRIYRLVNLPGLPDKLWQWLTVALAAQIGTAPLVIHYFNQFPNYFWLTNFIAIPAAAGIIIFALLFLIFQPISHFLSAIFGWMLRKVLFALDISLETIKNLPLSVSEGLWLDQIQIIIIYAMILFISFFIIKKTARYIMTVMGFLVLLLLWDIHQRKEEKRTHEFLVYNVPNQRVYNYISPEKNLVFTGKESKNGEKPIENLHFFTEGYWFSKDAPEPVYHPLESEKQTAPGSNNGYYLKYNFMNFCGLRIYAPEKPIPSRLSVNEKISLDYIIISEKTNTSLERINTIFRYEKIVLDSSIPYYKKQQWVKKLQSKDIPYFDVAEKGAFRIEFNQKNDKKI